MSTTHARECIGEAEQALEGAIGADATWSEHAMLRAYSLARSALLRLDPREAPELVARACAVLALVVANVRTLSVARAVLRPALRLVPGVPS